MAMAAAEKPFVPLCDDDDPEIAERNRKLFAQMLGPDKEFATGAVAAAAIAAVTDSGQLPSPPPASSSSTAKKAAGPGKQQPKNRRQFKQMLRKKMLEENGQQRDDPEEVLLSMEFDPLKAVEDPDELPSAPPEPILDMNMGKRAVSVVGLAGRPSKKRLVPEGDDNYIFSHRQDTASVTSSTASRRGRPPEEGSARSERREHREKCVDIEEMPRLPLSTAPPTPEPLLPPCVPEQQLYFDNIWKELIESEYQQYQPDGRTFQAVYGYPKRELKLAKGVCLLSREDSLQALAENACWIPSGGNVGAARLQSDLAYNPRPYLRCVSPEGGYIHGSLLHVADWFEHEALYLELLESGRPVGQALDEELWATGLVPGWQNMQDYGPHMARLLMLLVKLPMPQPLTSRMGLMVTLRLETLLVPRLPKSIQREGISILRNFVHCRYDALRRLQQLVRCFCQYLFDSTLSNRVYWPLHVDTTAAFTRVPCNDDDSSSSKKPFMRLSLKFYKRTMRALLPTNLKVPSERPETHPHVLVILAYLKNLDALVNHCNPDHDNNKKKEKGIIYVSDLPWAPVPEEEEEEEDRQANVNLLRLYAWDTLLPKHPTIVRLRASRPKNRLAMPWNLYKYV